MDPFERATELAASAYAAQTRRDCVSAIRDYGDAIQLCIDASEKAGVVPASRDALRTLAESLLAKMEALKRQPSASALSPPSSRPPPAAPASSSSPVVVVVATPGAPLTDEEKAVLTRTSTINGRIYRPFQSLDASDVSQSPPGRPFEDPDGLPALSAKQDVVFRSWRRPQELVGISGARMVVELGSEHVRQTIVSDCSFVASLCLMADYERTHRRRVITDIIYPKDSAGQPVINASGKDMIKLHYNGVARKIVIDDRLPCDSADRLLCSYSANRSEFWVSLVEKAFLKIFGGYDHPGSNSNIDMYALIGWIPERAQLQKGKEHEGAMTHLWTRLEHHRRNGRVLVTVATGPMGAREMERTGLVELHAYAVLDLVRVGALKMALIKNPW